LVLVVAQASGQGKGIGRIRLTRVASGNWEDLKPAIEKTVEPGSIVCTDGWKGYNGLSKKDSGYSHTVIRDDDGTLGDNLLPRANRVASLLKRWLLGTHQGGTQVTHLEYYLDEFTFRFNRRMSSTRGLLFYRLVEQAVHLCPVLVSDLKCVSAALPVGCRSSADATVL
jgi:transposase-like protein